MESKDLQMASKLSADKLELLARLLEEEGIEYPRAGTIALREKKDTEPLSFSQQRIWFLDQLIPGSSFYNLSRAVRLKGRLNIHALEASFNEIMRRHDALRTTFPTVDGNPIQVISEASPLVFSHADLRELSEDALEAQMLKLASEEAKRPFDLSRGPLLRMTLLWLRDEEFVVLLTMHHIISDAWSMGVLIREMTTLYKAFSSGKPSPLPELPIQYADYAIWQRQKIEGEQMQAQLDYWKQQFEGEIETLQLPADRPRGVVQSFLGAHKTVKLSPSLVSSLQALSRDEGVTLFMTLLAAFKTLLYRYTNQPLIVVGTPTANRHPVETESLIGFFVNTLVIRADLSGNPKFRELLRQVRDVTLGAYAHQDLPFEKLVEALQPERSLSHTPLFQVLFAMNNIPEQALEFAGVTMEFINIDYGTTKFELSVEVSETPTGIDLTFDYNADLFEAATISRMMSHYATLLDAVAADFTLPISDLPMLTPQEEQSFASWNQTSAPLPQLSVDQLISLQAEARPLSNAVTCGEVSLCYQELNQRANQLAHYLSQRGIKSEQVVAVCFERSIEQVVALLGVMKAGGAYLPIDPSYPPDRIRFMLNDSRPPVLLTQRHLVEGLPQYRGEMICLDSDWDFIAKENKENPLNQVLGDNAAYVIYTSGSTGSPKAAINTHRGLCNRLVWMQETFGLTAEDAVLQKTPFSFDVSVWEFFWPLMAGARLVLAKPGGHQDPSYLVSAIVEHNITTIHFVPSMLQLFLQEKGLERLKLKRVICSGEALPLELVEQFYSRVDARLYNLYGPTEAAIDVTFWECDLTENQHRVPIGKPISNTRIHLLDSQMKPVPVGVPAELYISGIGLARGYLNRPELTAEKFIPDPFSPDPGARLYKTGDLARYLPDGNIEYLARTDHQVKLRGFRIELGEIEAILRRHPSVNDVAVIIGDNSSGQPQLVAYIAANQQSAPAIDELRAFLKEKLPEYMVPAAFVTLDALPLTPSGKLDRKALPAPGSARPNFEQSYVAPQTEAEEVLFGIWSQTLGIDKVGIHDNFFALGGDSIRSVRVIALARQRGLEITLQQLFQHQTIYELAAQSGPGETGVRPQFGSEPLGLISDHDRRKLPDDVEDAYPLTMLQAGMLYHIEYMADAPVYHNVNSYHLRARLEQEPFQQAVQSAVARHPVLRTSFDLKGYSEPLQLVHKAAFLQVDMEDIRHLSDEEQERLIDGFVDDEKRRRFEFSQPPLLRLHLHRRSEQSFQLTLTECHPILDGWSLQSTLAEIFEDYLALLAERRAPERPPLAATFRDFVMLEQMALDSEECKRFWKEKLSGCTIMHVPKWPSSTGDLSGPRIRNVVFAFPNHVAEGLKRLARSAAVPFKSVLMTAHMKVMSIISGKADILTGLVSNGRPEELDGEQVRGLFLNTLPFRLNLSRGKWIDLVRETFEAERELLPYRRYPFAALQREFGNQPLFETVFNYVHFHVVEPILRKGDVEVIGPDKGSEETNFTITAGFMSDVIRSQELLMLGFDVTRVSEKQMIDIKGYYQNVLEAMATNPLGSHDSHCFLPDEQRQLLVESNDTKEDFNKDHLVHQLFEAQASAMPDSLAVAFAGHQLSYGELDRKANQLANYLRGLNVGPEARVGVYMDRCPDMVVALLGVLKSGGAYVPLDPAYPQERLAFMLDDAAAKVLLTQDRLASKLERHSATVVRMDAEWETIARQSAKRASSKATADNLAYIIYTSGSTGRPKGTEIPHIGLANLIAWHRRVYNLTPADRATQLAALAFDASVWEIWPYLSAGASIHIVDEQVRSNPSALIEWLKDNAITISFLPTPLAELALEAEWPEEMALRLLLTGGDKLHCWPDQGLPFTLVNHYGPTENTVVATAAIVQRRQDSIKTPPIGRPISNTTVYALDGGSQPVPVGAVGELYIGGDSLARGYLKRPDLTAEKFVPDPFSQEAGARLYRTGDLVRYLFDGSIEFVGRLDEQINIRGFRIELGEIEAVLTSQPFIREAAVAPLATAPDQSKLVAYIVTDQPAPGVSLLRARLKQELPEHMVPSEFVLVESLPLTPNGKVDRKALSQVGGIRLEPETTYVAPRSEIEQTVAAVWREVLQREMIGINDNFFDLGGHSLRMVQVHGKLRDLLNRDISIVELFQYPTVSSLAGFLSRSGNDAASIELVDERAERLREGKKRLTQRLTGRQQAIREARGSNE